MSTEETLEENKKLRELLWIRHGCSFASLYGDDGEMQCGNCLIDFKRDPVENILQVFQKIAANKIERFKLSDFAPPVRSD